MDTLNNPHAFPEHPADCNGYAGAHGMTLRDWFAGQATDKDIHRHMPWVEKRGAPLGVGEYACTHEEAKYRYADAMIEARNKGKGE